MIVLINEEAALLPHEIHLNCQLVLHLVWYRVRNNAPHSTHYESVPTNLSILIISVEHSFVGLFFLEWYSPLPNKRKGVNEIRFRLKCVFLSHSESQFRLHGRISLI